MFSHSADLFSWILGMPRNATGDLKSCVVMAVGLFALLLSYYNAYGFITCGVILICRRLPDKL